MSGYLGLARTDDYRKRARSLYEELFAVSESAADEAVEQAGLPEVFCWDNVPVRGAIQLSVACQIRLMEIQG